MISDSATESIPRIRGHSWVTTWNRPSIPSASIAASTAAWIEATAPEWPRAKAIKSWLASSTAPSRSRRCATARSSKGITVAIEAKTTPAAVNFLQRQFACYEILSVHKRKAAAPSGTAAQRLQAKLDLAEVVRHVVERVVQAVADRGHRTDGGNGDEGRNQTVLDGGRTLFVTNQLQKLAHGLRSLVPSATAVPLPPAVHFAGWGQTKVSPLGKSYARGLLKS